MHKMLQTHLLWAFVANLKIDAIYALYPESFCDPNLAIQKVFAFSDPGGLKTKQSHFCSWFSSLSVLVKKNYEEKNCNDYSVTPIAKYLESGETFEANLSSCFTQSISAAAGRKAIYSLQKYSKAKDKQSI